MKLAGYLVMEALRSGDWKSAITIVLLENGLGIGSVKESASNIHICPSQWMPSEILVEIRDVTVGYAEGLGFWKEEHPEKNIAIGTWIYLTWYKGDKIEIDLSNDARGL